LPFNLPQKMQQYYKKNEHSEIVGSDGRVLQSPDGVIFNMNVMMDEIAFLRGRVAYLESTLSKVQRANMELNEQLNYKHWKNDQAKMGKE